MSDNYKDIQDSIIFTAGQMATKMRLSKSMGQLYAALYMSDKPVSLEELAKISGMSKGNASINIRHLERWNAVAKTFSNGSRKDYYIANRDIVKFVMDRGKSVFADILNRGEVLLDHVQAKMDGLEDKGMDEGQKKEIANKKEKISDLAKKVKKMKGLVNKTELVESLLKGIL